MIVQNLADNLKPPTDQAGIDSLEIYSLAIRSIIDDCKDSSAVALIKIVFPTILNGLKSDSLKLIEGCFDICD